MSEDPSDRQEMGRAPAPSSRDEEGQDTGGLEDRRTGVWDEPAGAQAHSKEDPAHFVLRGQPVHAIRLRRGAVVTIVALVSVTLAASTWFALRPGSVRPVVKPDHKGGEARSSPEVLARLPASYDGVPELGPPLPGDLGRPILRHQMAQEKLPEVSLPEGAAQDASARSAAMMEDEARRQILAARQSALMVASARSGAAMPAEAGGSTRQSEDAPAQAAEEGEELANEPALEALGENGSNRRAGSDPSALPGAARILTGSVIAASLITGIRSDLPGLVTAQVTQRVFDSATGRILLLPQGTRLIGRYDSAIAYGQSRVQIVWQRIILPDGRSIRLDDVPATDAAGFAGLSDRVDFHTDRLAGGVILSSLLGVGANIAVAGESDLVRAVREATQQNVARAGDQITGRNLQVPPTITIRPGTQVRLLVHRDLLLAPWKE